MRKLTRNYGSFHTEFIITLMVVSILLVFVLSKFAKISLMNGLIIGFGILFVLALIVVLSANAENKAYELEKKIRSDIEQDFPNTRATRLSNGKWLLSCKQTGIVVDEIVWHG